MAFKINIQHATPNEHPNDEAILFWAEHVLKNQQLNQVELTIRMVDTQEMSELNFQYRKKIGPTNVLSFPCELSKDIQKQMEYILLGDIIICPDVLAREAQEQDKSLNAHWAHIVIHGVLHLLGYDHMQEDEEKIMQALEVDLLKNININDPYGNYEQV
jgi:probable rRNA maturation factor